MWSLKRRNKLVEKWNKWKQEKKIDFMELLPVHYAQCGKTSNSLPLTFFPSNQFIVKFLSKTLIWRNFCEKTWQQKSENSTVCYGNCHDLAAKISSNQCNFYCTCARETKLIWRKNSSKNSVCFEIPQFSTKKYVIFDFKTFLKK